MFKFSTATGKFYKRDIDETPIITGYSGFGAGVCNVAMECIPNIGPVPRGKWKIGPAYDHPHLGPVVMNLEPEEGTNTFGRSLFRIHGDNAHHNASHGCIILPRTVRELIALSHDRELLVV